MVNSFPHRICFVEDSSLVATPIILGMQVLLNAEVDHFATTDMALKKMEEGGFNQWNVFVFDNRTGPETISGIELAHQIKTARPEALVVSLNSSDLYEMQAYGMDKLRSEGIEFWYKVSEAFLMIAWLADCAKQDRMIPREEWLKSIGETPDFLIPDIGPERQTNRRLKFICMRLRDSVNPELEGILMARDVADYLQELTGAKRGVERR